MNKILNCPCQSGLLFDDCCQPFLNFKKNTLTPTQLMRSRYSAYVMQNVDYLIATWHPKTLPKKLNDEIAHAKWIDLTIIAESIDSKDPNQGFVEFVAIYRNQQGRAQKMHELSRFTKQNEHWFYMDGEFK